MEPKRQHEPVSVKLRSVIRHPGQSADVHELQAIGALIEKKGQQYLQFEEQVEGSASRTTVKLNRLDAFIMRKGAVQMRLPFREGDARIGTYGSSPAIMELLVKTKQLLHEPGVFKVDYDL